LEVDVISLQILVLIGQKLNQQEMLMLNGDGYHVVLMALIYWLVLILEESGFLQILVQLGQKKDQREMLIKIGGIVLLMMEKMLVLLFILEDCI
jgi:hypothetical protein